MLLPLAGLTAAVLLVAVLCLARTRLVLARVEGRSMEPTLLAGERVLVWKRSPRGGMPDRVVVVRRPRDLRSFFAELGVAAAGPGRGGRADDGSGGLLIKRVARVAGERTLECGVAVPEGHLYLLGDNPEQSYDSRSFGYVPPQDVLGVVVVRITREGRWKRVE
ncbi:S26 family signal peptidase [Nonomuraea wenchangensis]